MKALLFASLLKDKQCESFENFAMWIQDTFFLSPERLLTLVL